MFSSSTQMKNWTFSGTTELNKLRVETNEKFMEEHSKKVHIYIFLVHIIIVISLPD